MGTAQRLLLIGVGLLSIIPSAFAEHEEQYGGDYYDAADAPLRRPANPAANAIGLLPGAPPETNLQTIREIQDSLKNANPKTLQALKQALSDIAQGKEVSGQAGTVALDLLSRIPDREVDGGTTSYESEPSDAQAVGNGTPSGKNQGSAERFKGFSSTEKGANGSAAGGSVAVVVQPGSVVKLISGEAAPSAPRGTTVVTAPRPSGSALSAFPYNSAASSEEDTESGSALVVGPDGKLAPKRARAPTPPPTGGGEELPTGEGGVRVVPLGPPGGVMGTLVMNTKRSIASAAPVAPAAAPAGPDKQRIAGVVTSFLGRFRNRAHAEAKLGVFGRIAEGGGLTEQSAMVKAAESPVYRRFQEATLDAGFSPTESLGAYYTVLVMAWVGTFGFVVYLMRETPWLRFALAPLRRRKKQP